MFWGKPWGSTSLWGLTGSTPAEICDGMDADLQSYVPLNSTTKKLFCAIMSAQLGLQSEVLQEILAAFVREDATGDRLDKIGAIVGLPRRGYSDDRYRLFLAIQSELLLAAQSEEKGRTGSCENILKICRTFIGDAVADPVVLLNLPPLGLVLSVPGVTIGEANLLASFISTAVDGAVYGLIIFSTSSGSAWGSRSVTVATGGTWGSRSVAVAGASTWGYAIPIGT